MPSLRRDSQPAMPRSEPSSARRDSVNPKWQEVAARSEEVRQYRLEEAEASLPNMFQKLRRNSKQIFHPSIAKRSGSTTDENALPDLSYLKIGAGQLTFFDLPPEIRNVIYEDIASTTKLCVSCALPKKKETRNSSTNTTVPALLLVSQQARLEYLPLLLECATITFAIRDFDFRNLTRVAHSLYSSELKALRKNAHLTIRLLATKPTKDSLTSLRRWAQQRTEDMYTLPLSYTLAWPKHTQLVPTSSSVQRINTYIQRRSVLIANLEGIQNLCKEIPEALGWELQPVTRAFERDLEGLGREAGTGRVDLMGERWAVPMFTGRV